MKTLLANAVLLSAMAALQGCLVINAALGFMGLVGPPAMQLAGTAYAVSEYTYEYAANDRTPDMVLLAKFDWLIPHEEDPNLSNHAGAFSEVALAPSAPDSLQAQIAPETTPPGTRPRKAAGTIRPVPVASPRLESRTETARAVPHPQKAVSSKPLETAPIITASLPVGTPVHTYVERPFDPLLIRLNRLENTLRQAESMLSSTPDNGIRLSVSDTTEVPSEQGISGTWSIRHTLMKTVPATAHTGMPKTGHSPGASQRSLNT
ncbi:MULTISPECIES: hypothetical protein [unclassified Pseudodesulfovibrio]|uniref:hypothetical protein n=1 Tax=unclassified Pseudodesulfovibrio TaxID=2661612 RepID=UPI000FEC1F0F|nr:MULTISPECIES: hypothetical protein [unclassified Pseudodesulfovibrio]MCJ2166019.1 hypothetical protein [Pseudodesulfovibrio sp. S3-i]